MHVLLKQIDGEKQIEGDGEEEKWAERKRVAERDSVVAERDRRVFAAWRCRAEWAAAGFSAAAETFLPDP